MAYLLEDAHQHPNTKGRKEEMYVREGHDCVPNTFISVPARKIYTPNVTHSNQLADVKHVHL
jgi:hypothetical protein